MEFTKADITSPEYLGFVGARGTVFNQPTWLQMYGDKVEVIAIKERNNIIAVFNVFYFRKSLLRFCIPPPLSPDCALLVSEGAEGKEIIDQIILWISERSSSYSQFVFPLSYSFTEVLERMTLKTFKKNKRHTYILSVANADDVSSLYAPKRRQQIRRAVRDGLVVKKAADMKLVLQLVLKTYERQGKSIDQTYLKKILFEYATEENSFAFISFRDEAPLVAYFCVYHNKMAYYLFGGFDDSVKHIGAGPMAMHACISFAKSKGVEVFDFEGSMEPSIEKYFKEFGGEKKIYYSFETKNALGQAATKVRKILKG